MEKPTHFESLYPASTRENEIERILAFIKEGNSCQVISLPGGGRSNLLGLLTYNRNVRLKHLGENQKWFHFVLSNFAEVRKRPLTDIIKFLFLSLIDSMHARHSGDSERSVEDSRISNGNKRFWTSQNDEKAVGPDDIETLKEIFQESIIGNDELILFQGLKRAIDLLCIEKELTVVFLFDRFEDYIPTVTSEFFTNLRVLRDRAKYRFSVVFSTNRPLEDLIGEDIFCDFYQFAAGHIVYLPLFDKPGLDFRIAYMEKAASKKLNKETIDAILKVTAGHPNLTRLCIETALESTLNNVILGSPAKRGGSRIPTDLRDSGQARLAGASAKRASMTTFLLEQKPMKAALYDIWKFLTPQEQRFLIETYIVRHSGKSRSAGNIQNLSGQGVTAARDAGQARLAEASAKRASMTGEESYSYLQNVGLIKENKITIPLFEHFVEKEAAQTLLQTKQKITFDPNTNEISKGDLVLSDTLSSSEFRLLKFLLQNSGKLVERDEIINAVWADSKSTVGVTDQALDQLIFRLRKKIEDNPNNPMHLQTVKGRGFRFTP